MNRHASTATEKAIVGGTAFSCSCAALAVTAFLLIPIASAVMHSFSVPGALRQLVIFSLLVGPPIVAALGGIRIASSLVQSMRTALNDNGQCDGESGPGGPGK